MARMYFNRPHLDGESAQSNLHVVNDAGEILSLSGDNSLGAMPLLGRMSVLRFDASGVNLSQEQYRPEPADLLEALAAHLGYQVLPLEGAHTAGSPGNQGS
jgi:hypothetical protein